MVFQVPQFLEIEQKIIGGKLTLKQFVMICFGALIVFGLFFLFDSFIMWLILTTIITVVILALGFLKIGGRSASSILAAAFVYYWNPSFYLWQSEARTENDMPKIETKIHRTHETKEREVRIEAKIPREFRAKPEVKPNFQVIEPPSIQQKITEANPIQQSPVFDRIEITTSKETREKLAGSRQVQTLWERISTSKAALPKREKAINFFLKSKAEESYEVLRSAAGEMEVARRVDFK